jgi:hypothetical protein
VSEKRVRQHHLPVLQPAMPRFQPSSTILMRWHMQCTAVYMPDMTASCCAEPRPCVWIMPHCRALNLMAAGTTPRKYPSIPAYTADVAPLRVHGCLKLG